MKKTPNDFYGVALPEDRYGNPLIVWWPAPGDVGGFRKFSKLDDWRKFVQGLTLKNEVPELIAGRFLRAQKLYYFGWTDIDLIKVGELCGLIALEFALRDRYGKKSFASLLRHMCSHDGLTDSDIAIARENGAPVVGRLTGDTRPTLAEIRNSMAHGDPFDVLPVSGLLGLIRDLIDYAYRK